MKKTIRKLTFSAIIAASYIVLTMPFAAVSFGPIQFRFAEALTLLPFISPYSIYGLFIGCFVSNILFSTPLDAIVGSLATLIAAFITYKCQKTNIYVAALAPVLVNAVIIGIMLSVISGQFTLLLMATYMLTIAGSQFIICYLGGIPFTKLLIKYNLHKTIK